MKTRLTFLAAIATMSIIAHGQRPMIELTFTAVDNTAYMQLDSIRAVNLSQNVTATLAWPDTVLYVNYTGIGDHLRIVPGFRVYQVYPNPARDMATIMLYLPGTGRVNLAVADRVGRSLINWENSLEAGYHEFGFTPGNTDLYFFSVAFQGMTETVRIIGSGSNRSRPCRLDYKGMHDGSPALKNDPAGRELPLNPGDQLLLIGFAAGMESGMLASPSGNESFTFQFAAGIPCPGMPTVEYEGRLYQTVQVFSQCWLKENLNAGVMIPAGEPMTDNGIIEKYCYMDDADSCLKYGGHYNWHEMMNYTSLEGSRGICPEGFHVPTDLDIQVMEGAVDSQYGIGDPAWISPGNRGHDAGHHLKSTTGWDNNGNGADTYGMTFLPAGGFSGAAFGNLGVYAYFPTSTEHDNSNMWIRYLNASSDQPSRSSYFSKDNHKMPVRCIRD